MSTDPLTMATSTIDGRSEPLANLLFDRPNADLLLRSQDMHYFRVQKIYLVNSSPVLDELIRSAIDCPCTSDVEESLSVAQLPESGKILHSLLTFIFPVTPLLPSTPEENMELLSVAQKYRMDSVLVQIRDRIARHCPPPTHLEPALHIYSLAQKYGLRPEALQAARTIANYPMTIEDLDNKFDILPCTSLYELWKYHEKSRAILASDLIDFRVSGARGTIAGIGCGMHTTYTTLYYLPTWLDQYIESIGKSPILFDLLEFNIAMTYHVKAYANVYKCQCASMSSQTIRNFWENLTFTVHGSFEKVNVVGLWCCLGY